MKKNLFENIINFIDSYYFHKKISAYLQKIKLINIIDTGFHKGEFYENCFLKRKIKYYGIEANPKIYNYIKKNLLIKISIYLTQLQEKKNV